jgi:pimeloyl-ACP methyl ester carboxylesterase
MQSTSQVITTGTVTSADGTRIGYRQLGTGPGLIMVHGGLTTSRDYLPLATVLADTFTVYLPDRRGRGLSDSLGERWDIDKACEDIAALLEKTGAVFLFGHSAGGLLALETALRTKMAKVAVYDPAVSINSSIPTSWLTPFESALNKDDLVGATIIALKGLRLNKAHILPVWVLRLIVRFTLLKGEDAEYLKKVFMTARHDMALVQEAESRCDAYKAITAKVLLLGGEESASFLLDTLTVLHSAIPNSTYVELPKLDHSGPEDAPAVVAEELRRFFELPPGFPETPILERMEL